MTLALRTLTALVLLITMLVVLPQAVVLAADPAADAAAAEPATYTTVTADFRTKLMIGFGMVFVLIITYLMASHRKNAGLREEAEFLKQRLQSLEGGEAGSKSE